MLTELICKLPSIIFCMTHVLLAFVSAILFSCGTGTKNEQTSSTERTAENLAFVVNPELVDEPFIVENHNQQEYPFKEVETQTGDLNSDGKNDKITLYIIDNWEDPGNFHKIRVELSGEDPYEFSNYGGWVTFNENYSISEEIAAKNQLESKNILLLNATPNSKLILLFGWVYANDPGIVTIIDPTYRTILFNKQWDLQQITDTNSDNFLELHGTSMFDGMAELLDFGNSRIQLQNEK